MEAYEINTYTNWAVVLIQSPGRTGKKLHAVPIHYFFMSEKLHCDMEYEINTPLQYLYMSHELGCQIKAQTVSAKMQHFFSQVGWGSPGQAQKESTHKCVCDIRDLMIRGCKCGHLEKENGLEN